MRVRVALSVLALLPLLVAPAVPVVASNDYRQVVDLTFPTVPPSDRTPIARIDGVAYGFIDDYHYPRSNACGVHRATDIMGAHGQPVHAAVGGTITYMPDPAPSWGWMIRIAGNDGRVYNYIHLGRDGGTRAGAYAPGLDVGDRVVRGQHIGYLGSSGNAHESLPHLHFEIRDESVAGSNQWNCPYINPFESLKNALARGDVPGTGPFYDIAGSSHAEDILRLAQLGITKGCGPRRFCPHDDVTRAQMAAFVARALELPAADAHGFSDVDEDNPFAADIAALAAAGITNGCGEDRYCPWRKVSRGQMASFLVRGFALPEAEEPAGFRDVPPDRNAHAADIDALAAAGITKGCGDGRYCPLDPVTRAQMASFLVRALDFDAAR